MKVLLESASKKQVQFPPNQVDYMVKNGWKKVLQPKQKTKPQIKPKEADK